MAGQLIPLQDLDQARLTQPPKKTLYIMSLSKDFGLIGAWLRSITVQLRMMAVNGGGSGNLECTGRGRRKTKYRVR